MKITFDFKDFNLFKPKESGIYVTLTSIGNLMLLTYSVKYEKFNVKDDYCNDDLAIDVKYWAELECFKGFELNKIIMSLKNESLCELTALLYDIGKLTDTDKQVIDEIVGKLDKIYNSFE